MGRRRYMHGKRRRKSSCAPFKHNHTIKEAYEDTRPTGDKINIPHQIESKWELREPLDMPELKIKPLEPLNLEVGRAWKDYHWSKEIKPLEAKPIEQPPISKELKTGGASILESLPKKRFENKPMYTMTSSGFQVQTSTAVWDEDSKRFKMSKHSTYHTRHSSHGF